MKIVSLNPSLTEILYALHDGRKVFGVTHLCPSSPLAGYKPEIVTLSKAPGASGSVERDKIQAGLSAIPVDIDKLKSVAPSVILTTVVSNAPDELCGLAHEYFQHQWMRNIRVTSVELTTLNDLLDAYGEIGTLLGMGAIGRDRAQRIKSQLLDWGRNLYVRLRNKKTIVISNLEPLEVAGCWIPDIVRLVSGRSMISDHREMSHGVTWQEVAAFAPDAIMVAPRGKNLEESVRYLRKLEDVPEWDSLPAVKRGEVVFADGIRLYQTGPELLEGAGVLVSAMAGLDAGYITKRDEFHRLRFVELHRHRFM
ncbi:MAG: hypothetical protein RIS36_1540 [Pseudomonadota bacterium]|jgi:iron complex transport system substrate-binding protein